MYKKFLYNSKEIEGEKGKFRLDYYIVEGEKFLVEDDLEFVMFGIESVTVHDNIFECESVYDVCCSLSRARKLCEHLFTLEVTPVTLKDIISDLICQGEFFESIPVIPSSVVS